MAFIYVSAHFDPVWKTSQNKGFYVTNWECSNFPYLISMGEIFINYTCATGVKELLGDWVEACSWAAKFVENLFEAIATNWRSRRCSV